MVQQLVGIEEAGPIPVRGKQPKLPKNAWNGASHLPVIESSRGRCRVCMSSGVQSHSNVKCEMCDVVQMSQKREKLLLFVSYLGLPSLRTQIDD